MMSTTDLETDSAEPSLPVPQPMAATSTKDHLPSVSTPSSSSTGTKRPAPSLLPAFEPLSSSPALPRPLKRQNTGNGFGNDGANAIGRGDAGVRANTSARLKYPTPVPTSSTGIMSSSPPRRVNASGAPISFDFHHPEVHVPGAALQENARPTRPSLARSTSERAPLAAVPTLELPENGDAIIMGRSSNTSHYQLSANRLISRAHVRARFVPAHPHHDQHHDSSSGASKMEIVCTGWNGLKLHCQGRTWELFKGDSFTSETQSSDIMVDVQDARVMIQWPRRHSSASNGSTRDRNDGDAVSTLSDSGWDESPRSQGRNAHATALLLQSSPLRRNTRIESPVSPILAHLSSSQRLQALLPEEDEGDECIEIYEDEPELPRQSAVDVNASMQTEATASFSSELSEPGDENEPDEENDPIVHSFGPFGADISGRMASILTKSPRAEKPQRRGLPNGSSTESLASQNTNTASPKKASAIIAPSSPLSPPRRTLTPTLSIEVDVAIVNHVVNQLAFSRLSSTPLSTIMANLPVEARTDTALTSDVLRRAVEATPAVGIIERQGKDAAGKPLESEYYYVPEYDMDEQRRAAVVDGLRKPSLRNCRKQHKVSDDYQDQRGAGLTP